MSKKSKKRKKHKKLSSSSSEEDEKAYRDSAERRQDVNNKESCAAKHKNGAFPTIKDVSHSSRQVRKPIYRLAKTHATDQKPVHMKEECSKTKSVSVPLYGGNRSTKAKNESAKNNTVTGNETVERGPSKPSNIDVGAVPRRTETSKGSFDGKSSQRSRSKIKMQLMSPTLVSAERKGQAQNQLKRKCSTEEPQRTENYSRTVKTREPSRLSSVSKESAQKTRRKQVKEMPQQHQGNKFRSKSTEAKTPSASTSSTFPLFQHNTSVSSSNVVKNVSSLSQKTAKSSSAQQQITSLASPLPHNFRIPKNVQPRPVNSTGENNDAGSTNRNLKHQAEPSNSGASVSSFKQKDRRSSLSGKRPATFVTGAEPSYGQMQVVEELHLARSERRLEMNVMQSYGELTCMDIDPPEEGTADPHCKQPPQQDLILVLDTNVLLSHLDFVKKIRAHGLGALGFSLVLIPWVVLQELDSLKRGRGLSGSVAHLATPAISYIYNSLKSREPHLWGQSMQQAAESSNRLTAENNDDRVLQCCLQYQSLYPECALVLCTNDKNLCSKALLSGIKALSKNDLEAEFGSSRPGFHPLQNIKTPMLPHSSPQVSSPVQSRSYAAVPPHSHERTGLSVGPVEKDNERQSKRQDEEETKWDVRCVSELEDCLREVLSDVLEVEMKAAYDDLWLEIVYLKPPWTLQDVLQCFKKHWIAVFGHIVPRRKLQTVLNLINFFNSGKTVDCSAALAALQDAKELVKAFGKSSSHVPSAIAAMDNIFNKLQPQGESPAGDVVMNDDDQDKEPSSAQVSHEEVWALFENIWSNVCQISLEGFKALRFDPHTMQSAQPVGSPPPPQDALVCLHKLSSLVSQLLQAFSSILSSAPGLQDVQTLLSIIHSNKMVDLDSRLTASDFLDCFSQQDYREKLIVGGNQLMALKEALDRCVGTTGQHITFTTPP